MNVVSKVAMLFRTTWLLGLLLLTTLLTFSVSDSNAAPGDSSTPELVASGAVGAGVSINSLGEIVWSQMPPTGPSQLFSSTRGQLTTDSGGYSNAAINNLGDLVWVEYSSTYPYVYRIRGIIAGQPVVVATSQSWIGKVDLNDRGEVVWTTPDSGSYSQIFSNIRGQLTSGSFPSYDPSINNQGDIVFTRSNPQPSPFQVFRIPAGSTVPAAVTSDSLDHRSPIMTDSGEMIWVEQDMSAPVLTSRIVSSLRGTLLSLGENIWTLDANNCGDLTYTGNSNGQTTIYRLGNAAPCVTQEPKKYILTVTLNSINSGNAGITSSPSGISFQTPDHSGSGVYTEGTVVQITPTVMADSRFLSWQSCDSVTENVCSITMTMDRNVIGAVELKTFQIEITSDSNGSISGLATVNYGGSATYTIIPDTGYHVADVVVDGVSVGPVTSFSFTNITANHTVSASFAINSYNITATAGTNGSIAGPGTVNYGENASHSITPSTGYHVADVVVDGVSVGPVTSFRFANVTANHTISASFAINSYSITAIAGANGTISGPASANYGSSATYAITPLTGYHVTDVLVDGVSVGAISSYTFANVTANHAISASFAINSYSIIATAGANGSISGPTTVNHGGSAAYTITPSVDYVVANVLVDGVSIGPVTNYNFSNVTGNHTISASFVLAADLAATSISGPSGANRGKSMRVISTIKNQGKGAAGTFTVTFYLSKDTNITTSDTVLGTKTYSSLAAGSTLTMSGSFIVPNNLATDRYYVGVIVDSGSVVLESNEINNALAAKYPTTIK